MMRLDIEFKNFMLVGSFTYNIHTCDAFPKKKRKKSPFYEFLKNKRKFQRNCSNGKNGFGYPLKKTSKKKHSDIYDIYEKYDKSFFRFLIDKEVVFPCILNQANFSEPFKNFKELTNCLIKGNNIALFRPGDPILLKNIDEIIKLEELWTLYFLLDSVTTVSPTEAEWFKYFEYLDYLYGPKCFQSLLDTKMQNLYKAESELFTEKKKTKQHITIDRKKEQRPNPLGVLQNLFLVSFGMVGALVVSRFVPIGSYSRNSGGIIPAAQAAGNEAPASQASSSSSRPARAPATASQPATASSSRLARAPSPEAKEMPLSPTTERSSSDPYNWSQQRDRQRNQISPSLPIAPIAPNRARSQPEVQVHLDLTKAVTNLIDSINPIVAAVNKGTEFINENVGFFSNRGKIVKSLADNPKYARAMFEYVKDSEKRITHAIEFGQIKDFFREKSLDIRVRMGDEMGPMYCNGVEALLRMIEYRTLRSTGKDKQADITYGEGMNQWVEILTQSERIGDRSATLGIRTSGKTFNLRNSEGNIISHDEQDLQRFRHRIAFGPLKDVDPTPNDSANQIVEHQDQAVLDISRGRAYQDSHIVTPTRSSLTPRRGSITLISQNIKRGNPDQTTPAELTANLVIDSIKVQEGALWCCFVPKQKEDILLARRRTVVLPNDPNEVSPDNVAGSDIYSSAKSIPGLDSNQVENSDSFKRKAKQQDQEEAELKKKGGVVFTGEAAAIAYVKTRSEVYLERQPTSFLTERLALENAKRESREIKKRLNQQNIDVNLRGLTSLHEVFQIGGALEGRHTELMENEKEAPKQKRIVKINVKKKVKFLTKEQQENRTVQLKRNSKQKIQYSDANTPVIENTLPTNIFFKDKLESISKPTKPNDTFASISFSHKDFDKTEISSDYLVINSCDLPYLLVHPNINGISIGFSFDTNILLTERQNDLVKNLNHLKNQFYKINFNMQDPSIDMNDLTSSQKLQIKQVEREQVSFHINSNNKNINAGPLTSVTLSPCFALSANSLGLVIISSMFFGALTSTLLQNKNQKSESEEEKSES